MSEAPPFWFQKSGLAAWVLSPIGAIYGHVAAARMQAKARYISSVPVFCVGNFIAGGAGKTPTAIAVAQIAKTLNIRAGFLSRGYGGNVNRATIVDRDVHNARDVGDEPLILSAYGPAVVSPDRVEGAKLLEEQGIDLIIMDDGFQNPSLHKDYSLAVVDSRRGIGNGFCIPAGPMRASLRPQLAAASAILLIGQSQAGTDIVRRAAKMAKPILSARVKARAEQNFRRKRVLAFAGISDPQKFYTTLEEEGAELVARKSFYDHHVFTVQECNELIAQANSADLQLVTTEKDAARMANMGAVHKELAEKCEVIYVDLAFENPKMVEVILRDTMKRAQEFRI